MRSEAKIAVLDACVLYPAPVRDLLLSVAFQGGFKPRWTELIQGEWVRNLLANRQDLQPSQLRLTVDAMNRAFPSADVVLPKSYPAPEGLPDPDDAHVMIGAIVSQARYILTFNLKDFPADRLGRLGVEAMDPDDFLMALAIENPALVIRAANDQVARLKNPPMPLSEVLLTLAKCGLPKIAAWLQKHS